MTTSTICRTTALLAALVCGGPTNMTAQDILTLPPALPWSGRSERLIAKPDDPWITPAEAASFQTTPRYAEVRAWLERLDAASALLTLHTFGRTGEGRDLLYVQASKGGAAKPVVLVQAGIHSGEIDGKDAGLTLLRDIALRGKDELLNRVDLVFVPIYNIDGHEQMSPWNFVHLRGPAEKGRDANARNIDLNRDYSKVDAPETRAMIGLLRPGRGAVCQLAASRLGSFQAPGVAAGSTTHATGRGPGPQRAAAGPAQSAHPEKSAPVS